MDRVPAEVHGRIECSAADGTAWTVPVMFRLSGEVQAMLAPKKQSRIRVIG